MNSSNAPDLRAFRLEKAQALLGHSDLLNRPALDANPVAYLQYLIDGLCDLSLKDPLTGIANRRQFFAILERELDRVSRSGEAALLLMLDIDHFKRVNDTYGHGVGDKVLQAVSRTLARCVRPMDSLARYGGEEFAMVLPACMRSFGQIVAERIRRAVENTVVHVEPNIELRVTISIGGAFAQPWVRSTPALWLEQADYQLYRAKSSGRNRVCIDTPVARTATPEEKDMLLSSLQTPSCWGGLSEPDAGA